MQRRGNKRQLVVQICNLPKTISLKLNKEKGANVHVLEVTELKYNKRYSLNQRCTISIFCYRFNIYYSASLLINTNINFNYFKDGLSISIPYQFFKKLPYQFQYQFILSMPPMILIRLSISYKLVIAININIDIN